MSEIEKYAEMAKNIGTYYYGRIPKVQMLSDHGSYVFRLKFNRKEKDRSRIMDKVIKIAKSSREETSLREQKVFAALHSMGFEVPRPEYSQEDKAFDDLVYFIVPWIPGRSLEEIYDKNPDRAMLTVKKIENFIKRLSEVPPGSVDGALDIEQGLAREMNTWANTLKLFEQNREWIDPIVFDLMEESKKLLNGRYNHLVHRDGPQVITDGVRHFAVIDWADAGAGHPLRSLGIKTGEYLIWIKEPIREQDWRNWLIQGYFGNQPMSDKIAKELRLLTVYYMMLITRSNLKIGNYAEAQRISGLVRNEVIRAT